MQPDFDKAQAFTRQLASCLSDITSPLHEIRSAFDFIFLNSLFHHNWEQPYIRDELGDLSYQFIWPEVGEVHPSIPSMVLDEIVFYHAGAQVARADGTLLFSLTPGDMVGMKLFNSCYLDWQGGWAKPMDQEAYAQGGTVEAGVPNEVMLPPLVARSLHHAMSLFGGTSGFEPRIALVRPTDRKAASDPSDLLINRPPFPSEDFSVEMNRFVHVVRRYAPEHIARRIFVSSEFVTGQTALVPLRSLFSEPKLVEGRLVS